MRAMKDEEATHPEEELYWSLRFVRAMRKHDITTASRCTDAYPYLMRYKSTRWHLLLAEDLYAHISGLATRISDALNKDLGPATNAKIERKQSRNLTWAALFSPRRRRVGLDNIRD